MNSQDDPFDRICAEVERQLKAETEEPERSELIRRLHERKHKLRLMVMPMDGNG